LVDVIVSEKRTVSIFRDKVAMVGSGGNLWMGRLKEWANQRREMRADFFTTLFCLCEDFVLARNFSFI
jgi:hypothetical protein